MLQAVLGLCGIPQTRSGRGAADPHQQVPLSAAGADPARLRPRAREEPILQSAAMQSDLLDQGAGQDTALFGRPTGKDEGGGQVLLLPDKQPALAASAHHLPHLAPGALRWLLLRHCFRLGRAPAVHCGSPRGPLRAAHLNAGGIFRPVLHLALHSLLYEPLRRACPLGEHVLPVRLQEVRVARELDERRLLAQHFLNERDVILKEQPRLHGTLLLVPELQAVLGQRAGGSLAPPQRLLPHGPLCLRLAITLQPLVEPQDGRGAGEGRPSGQAAEAAVQVQKPLVARVLREVAALIRLEVSKVNALEEGVGGQVGGGRAGPPELQVRAEPGSHELAVAAAGQEPVLDKVGRAPEVAGEVGAPILNIPPAADLVKAAQHQHRGVDVDAAMATQQRQLGAVGAVLRLLQLIQGGRQVLQLHEILERPLVHHPHLPVRVAQVPALHAELVEGRHHAHALVPVRPDGPRRMGGRMAAAGGQATRPARFGRGAAAQRLAAGPAPGLCWLRSSLPLLRGLLRGRLVEPGRRARAVPATCRRPLHQARLRTLLDQRLDRRVLASAGRAASSAVRWALAVLLRHQHRLPVSLAWRCCRVATLPDHTGAVGLLTLLQGPSGVLLGLQGINLRAVGDLPLGRPPNICNCTVHGSVMCPMTPLSHSLWRGFTVCPGFGLLRMSLHQSFTGDFVCPLCLGGGLHDKATAWKPNGH
mmetsp:Transcript_80882/g.261916  ORF Transcript_80882/g.261916 Transcript_80882/m.261916 type:complete len:703 (+) Transcript_80882:354-2462(+)